MATILAFPERRAGDWTETERARLTELAGRFAAQAGVNIAYGISDVGDPWCVVLDAHEEVLVHVARVNGTFVAHTLAGDAFAEARDLETAIETILGTKWLEDREGAVVPFAPASRQAQVVTAVLVAAAFVEHHRAEAATDEWALATQLRKSSGDGCEGRGDEATKAAVAVMSDDLDFGSPAAVPMHFDAAALPAHHAASSVANNPPVTSADDPAPPPKIHLDLSNLLADETVAPIGDHPIVRIGPEAPYHPGTSPDTSRLKPLPLHFLEGGSGDDLLLLDGGTVAVGGDGADRFVLAAPVPGDASPLLGTILDFNPNHDVIAVDGVADFTVVSRSPVANVLDRGAGHDAGLPVVAGERVEIDVNGDGQGDGHFLLASASDAATSDVHAVLGAFHSGGSDQFPDPSHLAMIQPPDHIA